MLNNNNFISPLRSRTSNIRKKISMVSVDRYAFAGKYCCDLDLSPQNVTNLSLSPTASELRLLNCYKQFVRYTDSGSELPV